MDIVRRCKKCQHFILLLLVVVVVVSCGHAIPYSLTISASSVGLLLAFCLKITKEQKEGNEKKCVF
jgi:hypothetical protein